MSQFDRERDRLEHDLMAGIICNVEYHKRMREIDLDERDAMREEAEQAYNNVMES